MAETIGSLVDKISILSLKIYHMEIQTRRQDSPPQHVHLCREKLGILEIQKKDLESELSELTEGVLSGKKILKVYRQFKMYNDPIYKTGK